MKTIVALSVVPVVFSFLSVIAHAEDDGEKATDKTIAHELMVNEAIRSFIVFVPSKIFQQKTPPSLVIALHGGGSNAEGMQRFCGLDETALKRGFIVVYPNGSGRIKKILTWNSGECCGYAKERKIDDVAFIRELIDFMIKQYGVDPARVYVTGMSNGAMMAYRLAAELSDRIAAIAAVAGTLDIDAAAAKKPVPILHFHGTEDQYVPYEGGHGSRSLKDNKHTSVKTTIETWIRANQVEAEPVVEELPDKINDGTSVVRYTYKTKQDQQRIVLYKIIGGGHTWPGRSRFERLLGRSTEEISANELMWTFFMAH
ncbi:MAG: PHB depolymerase family esterase [Planctomycetota bacterium]